MKKNNMEIEELITNINKQIAQIERGVLKGQEAGDFFADSVRKAKEIYQQDTDEWRLLDRWEHEKGYQWHPVYKSSTYAGEKEKQKLQELVLKLEEISGVQQTASIVANEYSFTASQKYEAYRLLLTIFKSSTESVYIIDNYLDEVIFDFLDVIPVGVSIKLVTTDKKSIFKRLYLAFKAKNNLVEAKEDNSSHDRYIVIDKRNVYSLGASINTFGKGDFMIHRLENKANEVMQKIETWWISGKEII